MKETGVNGGDRMEGVEKGEESEGVRGDTKREVGEMRSNGEE